MKKNVSKRATFISQISIVLLVVQLSGCVHKQPVPEERFSKAEELVDIGASQLRQRQLGEARRSFELAAELAPVAAAVDGQGCVALLEGRYEDAERLLTQAYEMDGTYDEALGNLGLLRELQGRQDEARDIYMKYLEKNPGSLEARNNLAALEYDKGRGTMETVHELTKALALSDHPVVRRNIATLKED